MIDPALALFVIEAGSGRQALDRLSEKVGLALVDLRLPDTDGLALIDRLKSRLWGRAGEDGAVAGEPEPAAG